jgi:hypothetical protein
MATRVQTWVWTGVLAAVSGLISGCRLVGAAGLVAVGVTGVAGYTVYKTGDLAVTGVRTVTSATGSALSSGVKSVATVVYRNGDFETQCPGSVAQVWDAASAAFKKANFQNLDGSCDALSGEVRAQTRDGVDVRMRLKNVGPQMTEVAIRVGVKGDLQASETIYKLVQGELKAGVP